MKELVPSAKHPLELVEADLTSDKGWSEAVKDCAYVIHTATPINHDCKPEERETMMYKPAVEGTERVLRHCSEAGTIKRMVLTSSIASVSNIKDAPEDYEYSEKDWTDMDYVDKFGYAYSKTAAEKCAWDFVKNAKSSGRHSFELVCINPAFVFGKIAGSHGVTVDIVKKMVDGSIPMNLKTGFPCVDVEDVAEAHVRGVDVPEASGKRFILCAESLWMEDITAALREEFGPMGYSKIPYWNMPYLMAWCLSWFNAALALPVSRWGRLTTYARKESEDILGIKYKSGRQTCIETVHSLIQEGHVPKTEKYKSR